MTNKTIPKILFFNVNGSGMGHMNRCLSYARRLQDRAQCVFFSLASAMEIIHEMGFQGDYYVSPYWSANSTFSWNSELAARFGLMLDQCRPDVVVFDGTWPQQGFLAACDAYAKSGANKRPLMVWSNRGLLKPGGKTVTVDETRFNLIIEPGELGATTSRSKLANDTRRVVVPPVCLLGPDELMTRFDARAALGLPPDGRLALFSLGPGNLKDVTGIGHGLIRAFDAARFTAVWARAPISVRDAPLPDGVLPVSVYPLARYLRAFDVFVGAAGYNACCEVVQAGIVSLLVPNTELADDQLRRARQVAAVAPTVVSPCETDAQRQAAVDAVLSMLGRGEEGDAGPMALQNPGVSYRPAIAMDGASVAADDILELIA